MIGDYFQEIQCTAGEQVKESINRKAVGWDVQESSVLKDAICGFHTEQQRSSVRKNKFGWHHQQRGKCAR